MKKFIAVLTAALCVVSLAAFAACGEKKSDEVTAEEWASAMTASNALNVTLSGTVTATSTTAITAKDESTTTTQVSDIVIKTALTISGTNITGNTYMYRQASTGSDGESEEETFTEYEVFSESSYSYVEKQETTTTETDSKTGEVKETSDTDWGGKIFSKAGTPNSSDAYTSVREFITMISDEYDDFEYADGAYRYYPYEGDTSNVAYVKINDGKLTSLVIKSVEKSSYGNLSYTYSYKYDFRLSNYGTTTVTVPEEFTYGNYYLNHVL